MAHPLQPQPTFRRDRGPTDSYVHVRGDALRNTVRAGKPVYQSYAISRRSRFLTTRGFEIALDHENGHIVAEVVAAKICCRVIDIGHEILGGQ